MVADHLSRILNAPIIQAPINEDFPYEHILAIFKKPWYTDIVNYRPLDNYLLTGKSKTSVASLPKYGTSSGRSHIVLSIVLTRLFDDAYQKKNRGVCLVFVINLHAKDTSVLVKSQKKFYKVGFTGPLCSKTHSTFASHVQIVRRLGKFREETCAPEPDS